MSASKPLGEGWTEADVNRWIAYHSEISYTLTMQRTALESALIPVTAYILVACVECYRRYPEMIEEIAAAMPPGGARACRPPVRDRRSTTCTCGRSRTSR